MKKERESVSVLLCRRESREAPGRATSSIDRAACCWCDILLSPTAAAAAAAAVEAARARASGRNRRHAAGGKPTRWLRTCCCRCRPKVSKEMNDACCCCSPRLLWIKFLPRSDGLRFNPWFQRTGPEWRDWGCVLEIKILVMGNSTEVPSMKVYISKGAMM